jgi:hypothetical protein
MTSLGKEFEVYRQLKPPFPPGFLDRLLVHLGDELITSEGERCGFDMIITHSKGENLIIRFYFPS